MAHAAATPEEAAAIAAAIEQFLRDTAPVARQETETISPWTRAGLLEGVGLPADSPPWV